MSLKVIIAGGGTGGHIYPGIAIAREFQRREPGAEILFVGTARGLESRIVPREGFRLELIRVAGLKNVSLARKIGALAMLPGSFLDARRLLKSFNPDIVIGVGGYSSGPVLLVAALMGWPTMVIEPNALPGFTNRVLARFIDAAAVTFGEAVAYFRGKAIVTGNPVRSDFARLPRKERGAKLHVLVFGGSQGAHAINVAVCESLSVLKEHKEKLSFTHQTGENDFQMVSNAYKQAEIEADVRPYIHNMVEEFSRADLLVCRAGATTAAEVAAAGKAAIMIPFPFAADDHQRKNAEAMQRAGAARMILQKDLTGDRLAQEILRLANNTELIDAMEAASRKLARSDSAERAVDLAMRVIDLKMRNA